jgi:hypothetical protein
MVVRYALLLLPTALLAQPQLPGLWGAPVISVPCPQDPEVTIQTYAGWEAYQTVDDTWDGPREAGVCIDLAHPPGSPPQARIDFDQTILPRPVFLRVLLDSASALSLASDNQYAIELSGFPLAGTTLAGGDQCSEGLCSGVMCAVRIPDSLGTGTDLRWYQSSVGEGMFSSPYSICVPTERFEENALRELIFKFTPATDAPGQSYRLLYIEAVDLEMQGSLFQLHQEDVEQFRTGPATYQFYPQFEHNFLVMYEDTTYPGPANVSYLDLPPVPNTATPTPVTAILQSFTGFNFQPYTQLRGGSLLGNDSLFHPLTVVNNGADLCLAYYIVELVWGPGDRYVHQQGHVEFAGNLSCFMFLPGSTLEVAPGSTFHYGRDGRGMLALIDGSTLRIGNGGELAMHGTLVIREAPGDTLPRDLHLTLGPGQRLRFAPGSRIHNALSIDARMKLVVTLDGGSIDISGLSAEDREKVVLVELPGEEWSELRLLGNPVGDELVLAFAVRGTGRLQLRAVDGLGRLVLAHSEVVVPGENRVSLPVYRLGHGVHLLEAILNGERRVVRFVKE